jgi:hypothetical protein
MRLTVTRSKATRALGAVLAHLDPGYVPGSPLSADVAEIGQALGLLPYAHAVSLTGSGKRHDSVLTGPRLVGTEEEEPSLDVQTVKFS